MDKVDLEGYQFFASPSDRALLSEVLARLAALEERDREREEEVSALREENRQKDDRIAALEARLSEHEDFDARGRAEDRQRLATLETSAPVPSSSPPSTGRKTPARIEELKARLKKRRGRAAFSDMREEMGLSASQFSQLIRRLDKRIFDIQRHPLKPKEKILVLRQQIGVS